MSTLESKKIMDVKVECEEVSNLIEKMIQCLGKNAIDEMFQTLVVMTHKMDTLIEDILQIKSTLSEEIDVKEINDILGEIIESVQNKDYILLMDLLQYEILEKINQWHTIISKSCTEV